MTRPPGEEEPLRVEDDLTTKHLYNRHTWQLWKRINQATCAALQQRPEFAQHSQARQSRGDQSPQAGICISLPPAGRRFMNHVGSTDQSEHLSIKEIHPTGELLKRRGWRREGET